ncbi:MAG: NUDIX hydrolase [Planctomycetota bacterium]
MTDAHWERRGTERGPSLFVARVRYDTLVNPRNGHEMRCTVLEMPEWVNVVALNEARELVLVRQYRFGTGAFSLEIPGGVVDPGEEPLAAAIRELREESGHTAERWSLLGSVEPNPAFQTNRCWHFLAEGARSTHPQEMDPGEDITIETLPFDRIAEAVHSGRLAHSLVIAALARVVDLRR